MCLKCANMCPEEEGKNFVNSIEALGGTVIGQYVSAHKKVECKLS